MERDRSSDTKTGERALEDHDASGDDDVAGFLFFRRVQHGCETAARAQFVRSDIPGWQFVIFLVPVSEGRFVAPVSELPHGLIVR